MHEANLGDYYDYEVARTISDAELIRGGASLVDSHFVITDRQYETAKTLRDAEQSIPIQVERADDPLEVARYTAKNIYVRQKSQEAVPMLASDTPESILQGIRSFVRATGHIRLPFAFGYLKYAVSHIAPLDEQQPLNQSRCIPPDALPAIPDGLPSQLYLDMIARQAERVFKVSAFISRRAALGRSFSLYDQPEDLQQAVGKRFIDDYLTLFNTAVGANMSQNTLLRICRSSVLLASDTQPLFAAMERRPKLGTSKIINLFLNNITDFDGAIDRIPEAGMQPSQRATALTHRAENIRMDADPSFFMHIPMPGEVVQVHSSEKITDALFSAIAHLDAMLSEQHGKTKMASWNTFAYDKTDSKLLKDLKDARKNLTAFIVALPAGNALQRHEKAVDQPDWDPLNPAHAIRLNLIYAIKSPRTAQPKQHVLDMLYYCKDGADPNKRRYFVASSPVYAGEKSITSYLHRINREEGQKTALSIADALNANSRR